MANPHTFDFHGDFDHDEDDPTADSQAARDLLVEIGISLQAVHELTGEAREW